MQNFSDTYFGELLHINNDSKLCNNNLFRKNKPPAPTVVRKDDSWSICQLSCCCTNEYAQTRIVCSNESDSQSPFVFTWALLTNQISNLFRSNYKLSLHMRAEAPNQKLSYIHKEAVQLVVFVNRWRKLCEPECLFHLTQVQQYIVVISVWSYDYSKCSETNVYIKERMNCSA